VIRGTITNKVSDKWSLASKKSQLLIKKSIIVRSKIGELNLLKINIAKNIANILILFRKGFISNEFDKGFTFFSVKSAHFEFLKVAPKLVVIRRIFESRSTKRRLRAANELGTVFNFC
jgi:hypothetical protein